MNQGNEPDPLAQPCIVRHLAANRTAAAMIYACLTGDRNLADGLAATVDDWPAVIGALASLAGGFLVGALGDQRDATEYTRDVLVRLAAMRAGDRGGPGS